LLALGIGAVFCFRGYLAMRLMITLWGALAGFALGASIGADDGGVLSGALSWILAIVIGLVFALVAYLYYEVSVAIAMGSIGFTLGASVLVALGVTWNWVIVLVGLALGVVLAIVAIVGDLPGIILVVLSALAGASAIVAGIMLLTDVLDTEQITRSGALTEELNDDWYWYVIWAVAAAAGLLVQMRTREREMETMRQAWTTPTRR
ncbi:MAG: DUF4203 domain-containing protein, partial [Acidimicrobiia bacterium]